VHMIGASVRGVPAKTGVNPRPFPHRRRAERGPAPAIHPALVSGGSSGRRKGWTDCRTCIKSEISIALSGKPRAQRASTPFPINCSGSIPQVGQINNQFNRNAPCDRRRPLGRLCGQRDHPRSSSRSWKRPRTCRTSWCRFKSSASRRAQYAGSYKAARELPLQVPGITQVDGPQKPMASVISPFGHEGIMKTPEGRLRSSAVVVGNATGKRFGEVQEQLVKAIRAGRNSLGAFTDPHYSRGRFLTASRIFLNTPRKQVIAATHGVVNLNTMLGPRAAGRAPALMKPSIKRASPP